ncbi:hypothetical protein L7F22_045694 [Adiantum nelumboides]|nr:hypothetical protein [Adiantum nelumboides]
MMRGVGMAAFVKADGALPPVTIPSRNPGEGLVRGGSDNMSPSLASLFSSLPGDNEPFAGSKPFADSFSGILPSPNFSNSTLLNSTSALDILGFSSNSTREGIINVQGQNTSRSINGNYKLMMPSRLPILANSTYLTIPPGLSPTSLLESPVFLNSELFDSSTSTVNGISKTELWHSSSAVDVVNQEDTIVKQQVSFGCSVDPQLVSVPPENTSLPVSILEPTSGQAVEFLQNGPESQNPLESASVARSMEIISNSQISDTHQFISERTAVDGYNWKKYGQKQLKGTEFPRSYYKCTYPNCSVKKQVECSHQGEITEILYKGKHNHAKPQGLRRGGRTGSQSFAHGNMAEASGKVNKTDSDRFSSELSSSSLVGGLAGTPEQSFGSLSMEEVEDVEQKKSDEYAEDEQESKRRRIEDFRETLSSAPVRTIREPRVIVQTTSEIDILDDGYRWRKYGQKIVKGNRFPRSYYKCTNIGCIVRKHVERSSSDPTSVMTAYEGKHNHNVPAARGSVRETIGATAAPLPFATHAAVGISSAHGAAVTSETEELGFKGGNSFDASMANPLVPKMKRNGGEGPASPKVLGKGMGFDLSLLKRFGVGCMGGQDLGSTFFQPVYQSKSPSCVAERHSSG